jgi:S1-C subfamily serine protease
MPRSARAAAAPNARNVPFSARILATLTQLLVGILLDDVRCFSVAV